MTHVKYVWDPIEDNVIRERDENGNTLVDYTTRPSLYGSVLSQDRGGQVRHYHYDGQGNTVSLTDDSGNVTDTRKYSAFGEVTESTGATVFPFQFRGSFGWFINHNSSTYIYALYRVYSSTLARFLEIIDGRRYNYNRYQAAADNYPIDKAIGDCQTANDAKVEDALLPPWPLSEFSERGCKQLVKSIFTKVTTQMPFGDFFVDKAADRLRRILSMFDDKNCVKPRFCCECCNGSVGYFINSRGNRKLVLCWNVLARLNDPVREIIDTITHELTHALQDCYMSDPIASCERSLKRELEAYYCEGACFTFSQCLRLAIGSSCYTRCRAMEIAMLYAPINRWFDANSKTFCTFPRKSNYPAFRPFDDLFRCDEAAGYVPPDSPTNPLV